jgi:hypothetical protein
MSKGMSIKRTAGEQPVYLAIHEPSEKLYLILLMRILK